MKQSKSSCRNLRKVTVNQRMKILILTWRKAQAMMKVKRKSSQRKKRMKVTLRRWE